MTWKDLRAPLALCLLLSFPALAEAATCETVRTDEIPAPAWQALELQAGDGGLENVCRARDPRGRVSYRAQGRGSGISVEVSPAGSILWRHWQAAD